MPTNIINITNTLTNIINMPAEVTNSVLRVAEMPPKAGWKIALMALTALGVFATMASAIIMWRSVEEMRRQRELQQRLWEEEQYQKDTQIMRELLENLRLTYNKLPQDKTLAALLQQNPNSGQKISIDLAHKFNFWFTDVLFRLSYRSRYKEKCREYQSEARNIINNQKVLTPEALISFIKNIPHAIAELEKYTELSLQ